MESFNSTLTKILSFQKLKALFFSCDSTVSTIAMIFLYIIGGMSILNGNLTVGSFTIITSLFNSMVSSAKYFLELGQNYQNALVSYNRIMELLQIPQQKEGNIIVDKIERLEFKDVSFLYDQRKIFDMFSYKFCKGNIYCITGENGIGKSTFIDLLFGMYLDEYNGEILINGYELHELNLYNLRKNNIGVCEQQPVVISETIHNNINLCTHNSVNNIDEFQEEIGLNKYVEKLAKGYNTKINIQSNNLSGGEKQKISLARVFKQNPDVMIFDEPTSAMDNKSKNSFYNWLEKVKQNKIIIVITHDNNFGNMNAVNVKFNNILKNNK